MFHYLTETVELIQITALQGSVTALCVFIMILVWLGEVASQQLITREDRIFSVRDRQRTWQLLSVPEPLLFEDQRGESQETDKSCLHAVLQLENLLSVQLLA